MKILKLKEDPEVKILLIGNRKSKVFFLEPELLIKKREHYEKSACWFSFTVSSKESFQELETLFTAKGFSTVRTRKYEYKNNDLNVFSFITKNEISLNQFYIDVFEVLVTTLNFPIFRKMIEDLSEYKTLYKISEDIFVLK